MAVRFLKFTGASLLLLVSMIALFIAVFDWNWLRGPINRYVTERTGREFAIRGNIGVRLAWPVPRVSVGDVSFANPSWAQEARMIELGSAEVGVDLPQLLKKNVYLHDVVLDRPVVHLEQSADGRKNWLLDTSQSDENNRVRIGTLTLNQGFLSYDDGQKKRTRIESNISMGQPGEQYGLGVLFDAKGQFRGTPVTAKGSGGPVLSLQDESKPYPIRIDLAQGKNRLRADGSITSLTKLSALDMKVGAKGASLADLFPLIGIALPETPAYDTSGRLVRRAGMWAYEGFSGKIGSSDIAGNMQVDLGGKRPFLHGGLTSQLLDFADLGPLIGAHKDSQTDARPVKVATVAAKDAPPPSDRVLPDIPFETDKWNTVDADVTLKAKSIRRAKELPIENLDTRLVMRDSVLDLTPLNFGVAGGTLASNIVLDGHSNPIRAAARVSARNLRLEKMFPTVKLANSSVGRLDADFDLRGQGNSVSRMLGTTDGKAALVVDGGEVSQLMMEMVGLHLWEILRIKLGRDQNININCVVGDFDVKQGVMQTRTFVFDTDVTTVDVKGNIDLGREKLDLTLDPQTKKTSPVALPTSIFVRGNFNDPAVSIDKTKLALRGVGAVALAVVNPLLTIIPLVDMGPGPQSQCARFVQQARDSFPGIQSNSKRAPLVARPHRSANPKVAQADKPATTGFEATGAVELP